MTGYVGVGAALVVTVAAGGHPNFWLWLALLWTLNALHALVLTSASSWRCSRSPRRRTGSGLIGDDVDDGCGDHLVVEFAATIHGSATPMSLAYFVFGLLAAASLW